MLKNQITTANVIKGGNDNRGKTKTQLRSSVNEGNK